MTGLWYLVFVLPLFLFTPDAPKRVRAAGAVKRGLQGLGNTIRTLPSNRSLFAYLGSSMLYRDALNGLYTFGGIYAVGVLGWSIVEVGIFGILANLTGVIGAWIGGRADAARGPKFVVVTSVLVLMLASSDRGDDDAHRSLLHSARRRHVGAGYPVLHLRWVDRCGGWALQAASRTLMVDQADPDRMTEAFGLYALSGRATSFLAPALIAVVTDLTGSQRLGVTPVVVLFMLALLLLPMVKQKKPT